jgi:hypothetical protein
LLRDPSLCEKLGRNGARTVDREYRFDTFRANLARILDEASYVEGQS